MMWDIEPDGEVDNSLSLEPDRCETCGEDIEGPSSYCRTPGGTFAFCSDFCFREFVMELERANDR
jgi:hypothetical protein